MRTESQASSQHCRSVDAGYKRALTTRNSDGRVSVVTELVISGTQCGNVLGTVGIVPLRPRCKLYYSKSSDLRSLYWTADYLPMVLKSVTSLIEVAPYFCGQFTPISRETENFLCRFFCFFFACRFMFFGFAPTFVWCEWALKPPFNLKLNFYRPRSVASEGYVFTGICLSKSGGGG